MGYVDEMLELSKSEKKPGRKISRKEALKITKETLEKAELARMPKRETGWAVVELTPSRWVKGPKDDLRIIGLFEQKVSAEDVLDALEEHNIDFNVYQLKEFYKD
jgi:hypothetical protein